MPRSSTPGRSLVSRRAIVDIVRTATLGSYGVTGFDAANPVDRLTGGLGLHQAGIVLADGVDGLTVDLRLTVAAGVPVAEVARQVDSAIRYAIRRALEIEIGNLTIHVAGLRYRAGQPPTAAVGA